MSDNVLVYRDGHPGCFRLLGVPTLIVNGAMAVAGAVMLDRNPLGAALLPLGVLGVAFGWILLFSRTVVEIDRARRVVTRTWSALFRLKRDELPLDTFRTVAVCRVLHRTRYRWVVSHAVELRAPGRAFRLRALLDEAPAQATAIQVSSFVGLPFEDARQPVDALIAEARPGGRAVVLIVAGTIVAVLALGAVAFVMTQGNLLSHPPAHGRGRR